MPDGGLGLESLEARLLFLTLPCAFSIAMMLFRTSWFRRERHDQRRTRRWILEQIHAEDVQAEHLGAKLPTPYCPFCQHYLAYELRWLQETGHIEQDEGGVYRLTADGERQRTSNEPNAQFGPPGWVRLDNHTHPTL